MNYEKLGVVKLIPQIEKGKLDSFNAELINSDISLEGCNKLGGDWETLPGMAQGACMIRKKQIRDVSIHDIKFGRFFTAPTAPVTKMATKEMGKIVIEKGAEFMFDCGMDTADVFVKHDGANMDIGCGALPASPSAAQMMIVGPTGITGSFSPKERI